MTERLAMILAVARNGVIGNHGGLPWSYPEDRAHYLGLTHRHAIIMGRRTFDETGEPREDCRNIVVSRTMPARARVEVVSTLEDALRLAYETDLEPFVIGGARLFAEALPRVTRIWLTEIPIDAIGDTRFELDRTGFVVRSSMRGAEGLVFVELVRDQPLSLKR